LGASSAFFERGFQQNCHGLVLQKGRGDSPAAHDFERPGTSRSRWSCGKTGWKIHQARWHLRGWFSLKTAVMLLNKLWQKNQAVL
jgi:hypothetical protein